MQTALPLAAVGSGGWYTGPMLALDYETTGPDPKTCRPVSVTCILVMPDGKYGEGIQALVQTGVDVPDGAASVHGITRERCDSEGVAASHAAAAVLDLVDMAFLEEWPVVIYNAPFDWPVFLAELGRCGLPDPPLPYIVDPLTIERHLDPSRAKKKLADVAARYGVELTNAHDATADCLATVGIARAQANRYQWLADMTLPQLQDEQVKWYAAHRVKTNQWLRRTGRQIITNGWPA